MLWAALRSDMPLADDKTDAFYTSFGVNQSLRLFVGEGNLFSDWKSWRRELKSEYPAWRRALWASPSMHEQPDGTILAISATGTSTKESLAAWISFLQRENPALAAISVVFRLKHMGADVISFQEMKHKHELQVRTE